MSDNNASGQALRRRPRAPVVQTHSDDDDDVVETLDARKWVERLKQTQKQSKPKPKPASSSLPSRRKEYSAAELAGLRVSHNVADLDGGVEHVLTLQDKSIDELEADDDVVELHSTALADAQKKKKRKANDDYEGEKEDDDDTTRQSFTIKKGGVITSAEKEEPQHRPGHTAISLDLAAAPSRTLASDFYTEEEAAALFRKPKKKKEKKTRRSKVNDDDLDTSGSHIMDVEAGDAIYSRNTRIDDDKFNDDDEDLQRAIAAVRRSVAAKPMAMPTAEDIARQVHDDALSRMDSDDTPLADSSAQLALSSTIEFVQSLKAAAKTATTTQQAETVETPQQQEEKDVEVPEKEEDDKVETVIVRRPVAAPANDPEPQPVAEPDASVDTTEPSVGSGLFATLNLLRQRNMLDKLTDDQRQREQQQRSRDSLLAEQKRQDAALALERQRIKQLGNKKQQQQQQQQQQQSGKRRGKADEMTPKELDEIKAREQEALDRKWAREYEERMRDYKPQVTLEYVDDTGRQLTTKEAYKQLSHAFHGHYSGKNKIDKVMAKREKERKQLEITSGASTHQYGAVLENAHKKLGSAGIVLSSGNKPGLGPAKDHTRP
ncbi:hypothetical protein IWW38_000006 [Coemansia aciculifera]|uniref:Uncharacterized protein n=1 Tax=Coemansia aciculifera TaxID=417176 RepID=A0ACC1M9T6_9FUNG|nr:hypothetical protein IWW38_000006 [Coemansia aciculifera]